MKFLIISGMSGAGKTRAADVLEDMDYYCVDNMPAALLPKLAEFCMGMGGRYEKVALVTDIRDKEGVDAIGKALKELENAGYIVRRQLRGAGGKISDTEYVIYEQPQQRPQPDTDNPDTGIPDTDLPDTENPYLDKPDTENRAELNKDISSKEKTSTDLSITHSFPPSRASAPVEGRTEVSEKREQIREQIDYGQVVTPANREQVNEFVEIMLEVALTRSPTVKIGRDAEYPTAFVQQRFEQLNSEHIRKVLDGIAENTTRVKNTRAYILAALFNAPSTIDNHYTMLVNHDLSS